MPYYSKGKVKINSLPLSMKLSTHISPPCFSTNSLQRINPRPVPDSSSVPLVEIFYSILNNLDCISCEIPTPVSFTDILIKF